MIPQRQTGASSRARETHGVMPNPRQVASEGKRSPSSKSALHKGFRTFFCELGNGESPMWESGTRGLSLNMQESVINISKKLKA